MPSEQVPVIRFGRRYPSGLNGRERSCQVAHVLHAYIVKVNERRGDDQLLGNFDGAGTRIIDLVAQFLQQHQEKDWREEDGDAALKVDEIHPVIAGEEDVLAATVKAGQSGRTSEFVDLSEEGLGDEVAFTRRVHHAELVRVLVLAKLPPERRAGFLVVHSPHGAGIKTRFWAEFVIWFRARFPDHVLSIERTVPGGAYHELVEQGELRKVTLLKRMRQADLADEERRYFDEQTLGTIRTVIAAPRLGRLRKKEISDVLEDPRTINSVLSFRGEDYNEVSVEVQFGGRRHTIHLSEQRVPRGGEDVTDVLHYQQDDVPTYDSLRRASLEYIELLSG